MKVLIVGGGNLAYHVARQSLNNDHDVSLIVEDEREANEFARRLNVVVSTGDGTRPDVLEDCGVSRVDVLVALQSQDHDNLVTCQIASEFFGVERTISLVNDPENVPLFSEMGVESAISAAEILGTIIERASAFGEIEASLPLGEGKIDVTQVELNVESPATGKNLGSVELPEGALVAAILRDGEVRVAWGSAELEEGDKLLVVSEEETQREALKIIVGEEP